MLLIHSNILLQASSPQLGNEWACWRHQRTLLDSNFAISANLCHKFQLSSFAVSYFRLRTGGWGAPNDGHMPVLLFGTNDGVTKWESNQPGSHSLWNFGKCKYQCKKAKLCLSICQSWQIYSIIYLFVLFYIFSFFKLLSCSFSHVMIRCRK